MDGRLGIPGNKKKGQGSSKRPRLSAVDSAWQLASASSAAQESAATAAAPVPAPPVAKPARSVVVPAPLVSAPSVGAAQAAAAMMELVEQNVPKPAKVKIQFSDGTYVGQVNQAGEPHGEGTFIYKKDDEKKRVSYEGGFENGKRVGIGKISWQGGDVYYGNFANDNINGRGIWTYRKDDMMDTLDYVGEVKNGIREGEGVLRFVDGRSYTGTFKNGVPHGSGTMTFPSGLKYQGKFKNAKSYEPGTFTLKDGRTVQLTNGKIILTNGTVLDPNRGKNKGGYNKGLVSGEFTITTSDKKTIIGAFNPTPFDLLEEVISAKLKELASVQAKGSQKVEDGWI